MPNHTQEEVRRMFNQLDDQRMKDDDAVHPVFYLLVVVPLALLLNGFVLSHMWEWFLVPFGVPAIKTVHAIGISTMASLLVSKRSGKRDNSYAELTYLAFFIPLFAWLIGYVTYLNM